MPVQSCQKDGKPGFQYGDQGACYTYTPGNKRSKAVAAQKAGAQGAAIKRSGGDGDDKSGRMVGVSASTLENVRRQVKREDSSPPRGFYGVPGG
jgi:hypothetical protein